MKTNFSLFLRCMAKLCSTFFSPIWEKWKPFAVLAFCCLFSLFLNNEIANAQYGASCPTDTLYNGVNNIGSGDICLCNNTQIGTNCVLITLYPFMDIDGCFVECTENLLGVAQGSIVLNPETCEEIMVSASGAMIPDALLPADPAGTLNIMICKGADGNGNGNFGAIKLGEGCPEPVCCTGCDEYDMDTNSCVLPDTTCDSNPCTNGGTTVWNAPTCKCVLETPTIEGCTDDTACNYDASATCDDGSCDYGNAACLNPCHPVEGCTNATACNYDSDACVDDGSCIPVPTCADEPYCSGGLYFSQSYNPETCSCDEEEIDFPDCDADCLEFNPYLCKCVSITDPMCSEVCEFFDPATCMCIACETELVCPPDTAIVCGSDMSPDVLGYAVVTSDCGTFTPTYSDSEPAIVVGAPAGYCKLISREWIIDDGCGMPLNCIQKIYIIDSVPPVIVCPVDTFELSCGDVNHLEAQLDILIDGVTATDNCDNDVAVIVGDYDLSTWFVCYEVVYITFTATDNCGNSTVKNKPVIITDDVPPVVTPPANLYIDCTELADPITLQTRIDDWFSQFNISDNCGIHQIMFGEADLSALTCSNEDSLGIDVTAYDNCENVTTGTGYIFLTDEVSPDVTVPNDLFIDCTTPDSVILAWLNLATADDNCTADLTVENDYDPANILSCPDNISVLVTFTAEDDCGKIGTNTASIYYEDNTGPSFDPATLEDLVLSCFDQDSIDAWLNSVTAIDCGHDIPVTTDYMDGTPYGYCIGDDNSVLVHFSAIDACGNESVLSASIIVVDETPPTFNPTPEPLVLECGEYTQGDIDAWLADFTAYDNCSEATVTNDYAGDSIDCDEGILITFTALDDCKNKTEITSTIFLYDTEPPILTVPDSLVLDCNYDEMELTDWLDSATAFDVCAGEVEVVVLNFTDELENVCDEGSRTIVFEATDDCGNIARDSSVLYLLDTIAPILSLNLPAGYPFPFEFGDTLIFPCNTIPIMTDSLVVAVDSCDQDVQIQFCETKVEEDSCKIVYYCFWKAEDDCGNSTQNGVYIQVGKVDFDQLMITCPDPVSVSCEHRDNLDPHVGTPVVKGCGPLTVTYVDDTTDLADGYCNATILRTWTVSDECEQSKSCIQLITIFDNEAPDIAFKPAYPFDFGDTLYFSCTAIPLFADTSVIATDNCDPDPDVLFYDNIEDMECHIFYECCWVVSDECGNSQSKCIYISLDKDEPLQLSCPGDVTLDCTDSTHPDSLGYASASGCISGEITYVDDSTHLTPCVGYIIRTWSAMNTCGEYVTCEQIINIEDNMAPVIILDPAAAFVFGETYSGFCILPDIGDYVTATDNCGGPVDIVFTESSTDGNCQTNYECTWTATDSCGNSSSESIYMEVWDYGPIDLVCPTNVSIECDGDSSPATTGFPTINGCLGGWEEFLVEFDDVGSCEEGVIYRTWTVSNGCGNISTCTQIITKQKEGIDNGSLALTVLLQGAMGGTAPLLGGKPGSTSIGTAFKTEELGWMRDNLRQEGLVPMSEPYTAVYVPDNLMGTPLEIADISVLEVEGENAIVDWVILEFRDETDPSIISSTRYALLQRDGDVVELDGVSPITVFPVGNYHIAIRHRNHLGVMTANALILGGESPVSFDFTDPNAATYGNHPQVQYDENRMALWAGNTNANGTVIYQGENGDVGTTFFDVLSSDANGSGVPNYIAQGYYNGDVNMSCESIYQGPNNDLWLIFYNVLTHPDNELELPNYIITEQLP